MRTSSAALLATLPLALALASCKMERHRDAAAARASAPAAATPPVADSWGDATTITTTDGGVSLSLADDTIAVRLSDRALAEARRDLDTSRTSHDFGGFIERTVKSTVANVLNYRITVPVSDVEDARYEDGRIELELRHEPRFNWTHIKTDKRPLMESFAPADAERFVKAVRKARGLD